MAILTQRHKKKPELCLELCVKQYLDEYLNNNRQSIPQFLRNFDAEGISGISGPGSIDAKPTTVRIPQLWSFAVSQQITDEQLLFLAWTHFGDQAVSIYKRLAKKGFAYGQTFYGLFNSDMKESVLWLSKAAKQGNRSAQYYLVLNRHRSPNIHLFLESAARSGGSLAVDLYLKYLVNQNRLHQFLKFVYDNRGWSLQNYT